MTETTEGTKDTVIQELSAACLLAVEAMDGLPEDYRNDDIINAYLACLKASTKALKYKKTDRRLHNDSEVCKMLGVSSGFWYRLKRQGLTPRPINTGKRSRDYFTVEMIDAWRLGERW
ncbi:hypothetical protein KAR91_01335 [Candidatus Pacearchaeota archaeon]|nr:hypothetical protein [Candidatus Pacearchaeota archaeon]